jgi:hypothetical protein
MSGYSNAVHTTALSAYYYPLADLLWASALASFYSTAARLA